VAHTNASSHPIMLQKKQAAYYVIKSQYPDTQLVLVHGIGVSMRYFMAFAHELAKTSDVYVLDLPGFGATPRPQSAETIESYAGMVKEFIQQQKLQRPVLIGHSMGCQIVIEVLRTDPGCADASILIGPVVNSKERTGLRQALRLLQDTWFERPRTNWFVLSDYIRCGVRWYLKVLPSMLAYETEKHIRGVSTPLLLLRGENDTVAPMQWLKLLQTEASRAELREIERSGHGVMCNHPVKTAIICQRFSHDIAKH